MKADGTNPSLLIGSEANVPNLFATPAFSPDGERIVFAKGLDAGREVYVIKVDGTGLVRLTTNETSDAHPSWSPDGSQIVFYRVVVGHAQIFVMNADGSAQRRVTDLSAVSFNAFPSWGRAPQASSKN